MHNKHRYSEEEVVSIPEKKENYGRPHFEEQIQCDYIYVDKHNKVHLLVPIVASTNNIGTDNTCKAYYESQSFFNDESYNVDKILVTYKKLLESDITTLKSHLNSKNALCPLKSVKKILLCKQERLRQITSYQKILKTIKNDDKNRKLKYFPKSHFVEYPRPIRKVMQKQTNCYSVLLCPYGLDMMINLPDPIFSLNRRGASLLGIRIKDRPIFIHVGDVVCCIEALIKLIRNGTTQANQEDLQEDLQASYRTTRNFYGSLERCLSKINITIKNKKERILSEVKSWSSTNNKKLTGKEEDDNIVIKEMQNFLAKIIKEKYDTTVNLSEKNLNTKENLIGASYGSLDEESTIEDFASTNLNICGINFDCLGLNANEVFAEAKSINDFAIRVQFFLAVVNIYCRKYDLSKKNFGPIFDKKLANKIADAVKYAWDQSSENDQQKSENIENSLFKIINNYSRILGLKRRLSEEDCKKISEDFKNYYKTISRSDHFDEFIFFIENKKGDFVCHKNRISMHFQDLINNMPFKKKSKKSLKEHFERIRTNRKYFKEIEGKTLTVTDSIVSKEKESLKNDFNGLQLLLKQKKCNCETLANSLFEKKDGLFDINDLTEQQIKQIYQDLGKEKFCQLVRYVKANPSFLKNKISDKTINEVLSSEENNLEYYPDKKEGFSGIADPENFKEIVTSITKIMKNYHAKRNNIFYQMFDIRYSYGFWLGTEDSSNQKLRQRQVKELEEKITALSGFQLKANKYSVQVRIEKIVEIMKHLRELEKNIQQEYHGFFKKYFQPRSELLIQIRKCLRFLEDQHQLTKNKIEELDKEISEKLCMKVTTKNKIRELSKTSPKKISTNKQTTYLPWLKSLDCFGFFRNKSKPNQSVNREKFVGSQSMNKK